jgi:hypothetical protein
VKTTVWLHGTLAQDPRYAGAGAMRVATLSVSTPYPDGQAREPVPVQARARHCDYLQRAQPLKGDEIMLRGRIGRNLDGESVVIASAIALHPSTEQREEP